MRANTDIRDEVVRGVLGGLVGAFMMIPMMLGMVRLGISDEPFPQTATRGVMKRAGLYRLLGRGTTNRVAWVAHLLYGATFGALFGVLRGRIIRSTFPAAPIFGMMAYAVGFLGWLPTLGIIPPLWKQRQPAGMMRLMGHMMYGAVTGIVYERTANVAQQIVPRVTPEMPVEERERQRMTA